MRGRCSSHAWPQPSRAARSPRPPPPTCSPYRTGDYLGFHDVLPPGTNGRASLVELAAFLATGARPRAQRRPARDVRAAAERDARRDREDDRRCCSRTRASACAPGDQARVYSPGNRAGLTIARDASFGVPHVYGTTRGAAMFGLGYVAAEDRLFFMDALRHAGRGELSGFAGGAAGNREMDADQWRQAPYTEADLQRQADQLDDLYGDEGRKLQADAVEYVAGVNQYISEARLDVTKMPGEYAAIGKPLDDWKVTDIIATASLVGGIFGKGGGDELTQMELRRSFVARYGSRRGATLWREWAAYEDADAPTTVRGKRFPYQTPPRKPARDGAAIADAGSLRRTSVVAAATGAGAGGPQSGGSPLDGLLDGLLPPAGSQRASSNALVVSGAESASGHPVAVFGPQVAYFSPQILMEQDVHAPTIDARGAVVSRREPLRPARPRAGLRVERDLGGPGHHRHVRARALRARRQRADDRLRALPLPRRVPADRGARAHEQLDADARRRDARRQRDAARAAHEARHRHGARDDQGQARRLHAPALDVHARDRLGARLLGLQRPGEGARRRRLPARGAQDRLHVQLALRRRPRHRVLQLRRQPAARRRASPASCRCPRSTSGAAIDPDRVDGGVHVVRQAPADDQRPAVHHVVEQQAGARLRGRRLEPLLVGLPLADARPGDRGADRRARGRSRSPGSSRRWARPRRPTCAPSRCCRSRSTSSARRATTSSPTPSRSCATGSRRARTAATATATGATSTPTRSASSTRSGRCGCARSSSRRSAPSSSTSSSARTSSTTRPTTTARTSARRTRAAGTATPRRTCAACSAARSRRRTPSATAARAVALALPVAAARRAVARARRARVQALRRQARARTPASRTTRRASTRSSSARRAGSRSR